MTQIGTWQEDARESIRDFLRDPIITKLLTRSALTKAQFETLLIDQLGHDMANKTLTREEMAHVMRKKGGISRGAMNRTLRQSRRNISQAIHTILLLGYSGIFESPSLAPIIEASEQLRNQTSELKQSTQGEDLYRASVETLLENLEEAFRAIFGKERDT